MREARLLAAAVVRHIRETLQAAHSHETHGEMLEALGDVEKAFEQNDETEALRDLIALSEALDMSIPDAELGKPGPDDELLEDVEDLDDDRDENTQR